MMKLRITAALALFCILTVLCSGAVAYIPPEIPVTDDMHALPQPQLAAFEESRKFEVYTGPGTEFLREADGRASVSTGDWIQVFGEEEGWLMIQYHVSGPNLRFGWIRCTQKEAGVSVPELQWSQDEGLILRTWMTNDPLSNRSEISGLDGTRQGKLLSSLGKDWVYVQTKTDEGKPARAFIDSTQFMTGAQAEDFENLYEVAWMSKPLCAFESQEELQPIADIVYTGGERVYMIEQRNGYARVYPEYGDGQTMWLPASVLMPVQEAWPQYDSQMTGLPPMHIAKEGAVLYTSPDESAAQIATFVRGMDVRVLWEEDGWCFVDAWGGESTANLRGYVRRDILAEGWVEGQTHPVMRLHVPGGEQYWHDGYMYLDGTELVLRAVSADGKYGIGMIDLRLPAAAVPMQWLEDTGRRTEWNSEAMGQEARLVSADGAEIPFWYQPPDVGVMQESGTLFPGTDVTLIAMQGKAAQVLLPGTVGEIYSVHVQNVEIR